MRGPFAFGGSCGQGAWAIVRANVIAALKPLAFGAAKAHTTPATLLYLSELLLLTAQSYDL